MQNEQSLRRRDFTPGVPIRLADGQTWHLPGPTEITARLLDPIRASQYQDLVQAIVEAESKAEMCRAELALTIFFLNLNYQLSPRTYFQILDMVPSDPALAEVQDSLHALAIDHVRSCWQTVKVPDDPSPLPDRGVPRTGTSWMARVLNWVGVHRYRREPLSDGDGESSEPGRRSSLSARAPVRRRIRSKRLEHG